MKEIKAAMRVTLTILACLAVTATANVFKNTGNVDKHFLERQKFMFEIIYRVQDPLQFKDYIKLGENLIVDRSKYTKYDAEMEKFEDAYKLNSLIHKEEFYSVLHRYQAHQGWGLFNFFYYAKNWDTFMRNVAWARMHVNPSIFIFSLTISVIHRPDTKGLILPSIYEIFPQMFFPSRFILHAEKFNWDVWNRQIMLEKEYKTIYAKDYSNKYFEKHLYLKDWKVWQWWKLMGLDEDWHLEEKTLFRDNIEVFKNDPKYKDIWSGVKAFWYPVDYTRDIAFFNEETKLSYFTEDIGWNAYWYYLNTDYPPFMFQDEFNFADDRHGEWWIYNVQQLTARYDMERISQGLKETHQLAWYGTYAPGYDSQLITYYGRGYTCRKNYWEVKSYQNEDLLNKLKNIEQRISDIIESGKYVARDGTVIDLTQPESIEHIGILLHGTVDVWDRKYLGYWFSYALNLLAGTKTESVYVPPHPLENFETMMRDPLVYSVLKRALEFYYKFMNQLQAYKHEELLLPGVKIVDVEVSTLKTYFDLVDTDVTNLLDGKMVFRDGQFVWDKTLLARQLRLNHKPFKFDIKVISEKAQKVVIRAFLAPDFDQHGQKIDLLTHRAYFMELEEFAYDLVVGENSIKRSSKEFGFIKDQTTYTELYKYIMLAYEGKQEFSFEVSQPHCGFPDRLILPHGWVNGLPMKLFFVISPFTAKYEQFSPIENNYTCGIGSGVRHIDDLPLGFPFDRKIENLKEFFVPNMFFKDVKIYHTDKSEKYYPEKYEHFGNFDYSF